MENILLPGPGPQRKVLGQRQPVIASVGDLPQQLLGPFGDLWGKPPLQLLCGLRQRLLRDGQGIVIFFQPLHPAPVFGKLPSDFGGISQRLHFAPAGTQLRAKLFQLLPGLLDRRSGLLPGEGQTVRHFRRYASARHGGKHLPVLLQLLRFPLGGVEKVPLFQNPAAQRQGFLQAFAPAEPFLPLPQCKLTALQLFLLPAPELMYPAVLSGFPAVVHRQPIPRVTVRRSVALCDLSAGFCSFHLDEQQQRQKQYACPHGRQSGHRVAQPQTQPAAQQPHSRRNQQREPVLPAQSAIALCIPIGPIQRFLRIQPLKGLQNLRLFRLRRQRFPLLPQCIRLRPEGRQLFLPGRRLLPVRKLPAGNLQRFGTIPGLLPG